MIQEMFFLLVFFSELRSASSTTSAASVSSSTTDSTPTKTTSTTTTSTTTSITTTTTTTTATTLASPLSTNLSCYDCSESFKYLWEPYTDCQYYPKRNPLRPCLDTETYCKVERVTYKSMTVSITRGCTKDCWHGCYASGFGLTKLKCTSCCLTPGCNIGDTGAIPGLSCCTVIILSMFSLTFCDMFIPFKRFL